MIKQVNVNQFSPHFRGSKSKMDDDKPYVEMTKAVQIFKERADEVKDLVIQSNPYSTFIQGTVKKVPITLTKVSRGGQKRIEKEEEVRFSLKLSDETVRVDTHLKKSGFKIISPVGKPKSSDFMNHYMSSLILKFAPSLKKQYGFIPLGSIKEELQQLIKEGKLNPAEYPTNDELRVLTNITGTSTPGLGLSVVPLETEQYKIYTFMVNKYSKEWKSGDKPTEEFFIAFVRKPSRSEKLLLSLLRKKWPNLELGSRLGKPTPDVFPVTKDSYLFTKDFFKNQEILGEQEYPSKTQWYFKTFQRAQGVASPEQVEKDLAEAGW